MNDENKKACDGVALVPAVQALAAIRAVTGRYMRKLPVGLALEGASARECRLAEAAIRRSYEHE